MVRKQLHLRGAGLAWALGLVQGLISLGVALIVLVSVGSVAATAAVYGGLIAIIPTAFFALRVFLRRPDASPRDVVRGVYRGEFGKFVLTVLMFIGGVVWFGDQFLFVLCGYISCIAAYPVVMATARID